MTGCQRASECRVGGRAAGRRPREPLGCQSDVCWVTDWLSRCLDGQTGRGGRSNQREREREKPEMLMIAVIQCDMWNTKCINPVLCSPVTMHLSTAAECECTREKRSFTSTQSK